jgi:hypothetical protein
MPNPLTRPAGNEPAPKPAVSAATLRSQRAQVRPFAGLIDSVLVDDPCDFAFDGSVSRDHAAAAWIWISRDVAPESIDFARVEENSLTAADVEPVLLQVLAQAREAYEAAEADFDTGRRLRAQLGGDEAFQRLPFVLAAARSRALLEKAQTFGRALNGLTEESTISAALQSMPTKDSTATALLMHAALGQVSNPTKLVTAALKLAGAAAETSIQRAGLAPLIDAMLAHAQNQLHFIQPVGAFADIDLTCRALERFHRLVRAVTGYIELQRGSRWSHVIGMLTKQVSERVEPRLRNVIPDMNGSLRRGRDGSDRLDDDRLLAALNGVYLLATLRECKESLALNALFEQAWSQSGQALELHVGRNLELLRANPADAIVAKRLDTSIKMAEVRFNPDYAETLRRARVAAVKR